MKKLLILATSIMFFVNVFTMDVPTKDSDVAMSMYEKVEILFRRFQEIFAEEKKECFEALEAASTVTDEKEKIKLLKFAFYGPNHVNISSSEKMLIERRFGEFVEKNIELFCTLSFKN